MHNWWLLDEDDRDFLREVAKAAFWYACFLVAAGAGIFILWLIVHQLTRLFV